MPVTVSKQVEKIRQSAFKIWIPRIRRSQLILDFKPIIDRFELTGNYQLIHWQAIPKGYREWGVYSSGDDSYSSLPSIMFSGNCTSLQIPDQEATSTPSAVIVNYLNNNNPNLELPPDLGVG